MLYNIYIYVSLYMHYITLHYITLIYIHTLQYMFALVKKTQVIVGLSLAETGMELLFEVPCSGCWKEESPFQPG